MDIVSLFSGAGGLDLGFQMAGHHVIWANDLYHDAVMTYRNNIGDHIIEQDIREIPSDQIPDCDMVMGGFPCQGFSVANVGRNEQDQRNFLYLELLRVIRDKRPRFFLAENVKGILSLGRGAVFARIIQDFADLGYNVQHQVLLAANYGVPQKRERVIIVGVRNDVQFDFHYPIPTHARVADEEHMRWVSVGEAIGDLADPDLPNNLPNHNYSTYVLNINGYIGHRLLDPDQPSPTITARGDDRGGVVVHPHPNGLRRITGREAATIQSFPLNYEFYGSLTSVYRQIGNAVPPLMACRIAQQFPL